jgi:hypothetical protein
LSRFRIVSTNLTLRKRAAADLIDPTWTVALKRADDAGKMLADALLSRAAGTRPVSLVGFSMGARVIFSALVELAAKAANTQDDSHPTGIIDTVVLLGTPISCKQDKVSRPNHIQTCVVFRVLIFGPNTAITPYICFQWDSVRSVVAG